jgi:hypothetical protein
MTTIPTTTAVQAPSDEQITQIATAAHAEGRLPWAGFKKDADGFYTIPLLSQSHVALVRAVLAAMQPNAAPTAAPEQAGAVAKAYDLGFRCAARWAQRMDLFADVDSPAYKNDRSDDLMDLMLGDATFPGDLCKRCYGSGRDPAPGAAIAAREQEATTSTLDVCTDSDNCNRCKTAMRHRGSLDHAGIPVGNSYGATPSEYDRLKQQKDEILRRQEGEQIGTVLALAHRYTTQPANIWRTFVPHSLGEFIELKEFRSALVQALASREEAPAASAVLALHPATADLVRRFAKALAEKLAKAEKKYGYSDGWLRTDWMDECRAKLMEHIDKGDPRDVAAYCAFLWHHGESTASRASPATVAQPVEDAASRKSAKAAAEYEVRQWMGENDVVLKSHAYRNLIALVLAAQSAAQPYPSQGCGGEGSEAARTAALKKFVDYMLWVEQDDPHYMDKTQSRHREDALNAAFDVLLAALSTTKSEGQQS